MAARFLGVLHFLVLVASDSEPLGETSRCLEDLERARERERLFLNCERARGGRRTTLSSLSDRAGL